MSAQQQSLPSSKEIYKKISKFIPDSEWKIHAPLIEKINKLKKEKNAIHAGVVLGPENKLPKSDQVTNLKLIYDKKIVDAWENKIWPKDMLCEIEWLVKEQSKINNILKKGNLILTGAYGFPILINEKKLIEVTSSAFGNVQANFI